MAFGWQLKNKGVMSKESHAVVKGYFPLIFMGVVAENIYPSIIPADFKIPVIRRQPAVHYLIDMDFPVFEPDLAGGFFSPVSGMTEDGDFHRQTSR
jgi:hypothetical protein